MLIQKIRSSPSEMHLNKGVLENVTGKYLCWPATLLKETPTKAYFSEICKIFKNTFFYRTPPVVVSGKSI